jgi:hypothetical protein
MQRAASNLGTPIGHAYIIVLGIGEEILWVPGACVADERLGPVMMVIIY